MIRFACPACAAIVTAPSNKVGAVNPCPSCGQMVQVPEDPEKEEKATRRRREGPRAFLALLRLFLWGLCLAAVIVSLTYFFQDIHRERDDAAKTAFAVQALVWILGSYYAAQTFDSATKSLEELCARFRRKR